MNTKIKILVVAIIFPMFVNHVQAQAIRPAEVWGGQQQFKEFIKNEMQYPQKELSNKIQGEVQIAFTIDVTGEVQDIKIYQSINPALDKEALRLSKMLLWTPAKHYSKFVADNRILSFKFSTKKYKKYCKERGYTTIPAPELPIDESYNIYSFKQVDLYPKAIFADAEMNLQKYLIKNFKYPQSALDNSIEGIVELEYIIESNGHVSNIKPIKTLGAGCTEEAIRLIQSLSWEPAEKKGKSVRFKNTFSLTFNLSGESATFNYQHNFQNNSL